MQRVQDLVKGCLDKNPEMMGQVPFSHRPGTQAWHSLRDRTNFAAGWLIPSEHTLNCHRNIKGPQGMSRNQVYQRAFFQVLRCLWALNTHTIPHSPPKASVPTPEGCVCLDSEQHTAPWGHGISLTSDPSLSVILGLEKCQKPTRADYNLHSHCSGGGRIDTCRRG